MRTPRLALTSGALLCVACAHATTHEVGTASSSSSSRSSPRVGPARGSVIVVGGGTVGKEILDRFIELAGGPDALIVDVPTAGGDSMYGPEPAGVKMLKAAGARNVVMMHTINRTVANSESFTAPLAKAGGVWFEGGRQWHLVDSYSGTKSEQGFHDVLARGGVAAGSSAGASILSSYLLRGARAGNETVMAPGYEMGFGFLRGVAIDQHVVARERLPDLADSLMPKHPELLGISEDEGTAWLVRGDTADIIGRNKAFVYGGRDATDARKPFLTLRPGDRYNLATRHVMRRAIAGSALKAKYVDQLFAAFSKAGAPAATVLVAQDGKVLVNTSYNVSDQKRYMPTTTVPNFTLGALSLPFHATAALMLEKDGKLSLDDALSQGVSVGQYLSHSREVLEANQKFAALAAQKAGGTYLQYVTRRIMTPIGMHKTAVAANGEWSSNVDELYRWEVGLASYPDFTTSGKHDAFTATGNGGYGLGWQVDTYRGATRVAAYGADGGKRHAFVRIPERHLVVIILTENPNADAKGMAEKIMDRLMK